MEKTRLIVWGLLCLLFWGFCFGISHGESTSLKVRDIPDAHFFEIISAEIKKAQKSITLILASFAYQENNPEDPMVKAVQNLLLSHMEGVQIHLVLNRPYHLHFQKDGARQIKKDPAFALLEAQGIPLTLLSEAHTVFYNLIIIESSVPWITGLEYDTAHFSSTLIEDSALAENKMKKVIAMGMADYKDKKKERDLGNHITVPDILMQKKYIKGFMRSRRPLLPTYLVLLNMQLKTRAPVVPLSFKKVGQQIFKKNIPVQDQTRQITDTLNILSRKMKLLTLKRIQGQITGFTVNLPVTENTQAFQIPMSFLKYGYAGVITREELLVYLFILHEAQKQKTYPEWPYASDWKKKLPSELKKEAEALLIQLEKIRLIEPVLDAASLHKEAIPHYQLLKPQNPAMLKREFQALSQSYDPEHVRKAIFLATQLNFEQQPDVIRNLCYFLEELGFLETQKILKQISDLPKFHPHRNFSQIKLYLLQKLDPAITAFLWQNLRVLLFIERLGKMILPRREILPWKRPRSRGSWFLMPMN